MNSISPKTALTIVKKFINDSNGFEFIPLEDWNDNLVYLVFPKDTTEDTNVGLPIYVLIDKLGKARYADSKEQYELLIRSQAEEAGNNCED